MPDLLLSLILTAAIAAADFLTAGKDGGDAKAEKRLTWFSVPVYAFVIFADIVLGLGVQLDLGPKLAELLGPWMKIG
jgi:hypothetical protein